MNAPIKFWRGRRHYQIAPAHEGGGLSGLCNGRVSRQRLIGHLGMRIILMRVVWIST